MENDKVIKLALQRFNQARDAESKIRKDALDDLKFRAGEQWPDNIVTGRTLEQRPCLTINRIPQFVRQITNDARMNRPAIRVNPVDDTTEDEADIFEGLIRHIEVSSNADVAYDTAIDYQATGGFGYFRVITDYCDENSFEQEIKIKAVKDPFMIYFDPFSREPDGSDANYCFIVEDMQKEEFKKQYPKAKSSSEALTSIGDSGAEWITDETIRVAEYFSVEEEEARIHLLEDGSTVDADKYDEQAQSDMAFINPMPSIIKTRSTTRRKVMWRKITSAEVLEEREWAGKYIPVIPVLGEELIVDGERKLIGVVRYSKDSQRMYNYWSTAQTEAIALAPKAPWLIAEGQVEGYEKLWANANRENKAFLPYKPTTIDGIVVPPPQRIMVEPPVQAMVQAIQQAGEDMKATTGIYDAALGARSNETSGVAINARKQEGDVANYHLIDNLMRSIRHLGVILVDLVPKIYDSARVVRILHEDGTQKLVKINQIFQDEDGKQKEYNLALGKYDVTVDTGPSYTTKRQEAAAMMQQIIQAYPNIMQIAGDIMFRNYDMPGAEELADRMKIMLPPQILQAEEGNKQLPPQVMAQMQQAQQMIDQLTQQLHAMQDEKDAKEQDNASKERIAAQNNETKLAIAEMQANITNAMEIFREELIHLRHAKDLNMQAEQLDAQMQNANNTAQATVAESTAGS